MKCLLFLVFSLFLISLSLAQADDFTLSGYTEIGKRSTADDYEEEDTDDEYNYQNYHLRLKQDISDRLSYNISSFIYDKNYKSQDSLDNLARIFKINWSYTPPRLRRGDSQSRKTEESVKIDLKLQYKEKRYKNTPTSEYDQIRFEPQIRFKEELYALNFAYGVNNYEYLAPGQKDELRFFGKLGAERYFMEKKMTLTADYKIDQAEQHKADRKKTKHEVLGGADYVFDPSGSLRTGLPWLYKITARAGWGERDTKEDEERDVELDYEYWRYYVKSEHRISERLETSLKYQYFKKDYINSTLDNRGFYLENSWDCEVFEDEKQKLDLGFDFEHKALNYPLRAGNDYEREAISIRAGYQQKKGWKANAALEANFYNFDNSDSDKKRLYAKFGLEKLFFAGDVTLGVDFKYRYTDYKQGDDKKDEAVRTEFKYKF